MELRESIESGNIALFEASGHMLGGADTTELHDRIRHLVTEGVRQMVIDLNGVKWMNSSGLGCLMACMSTLQQAGGALKLTGITEKVESILLITKLNEVFDIADSAEAALAEFRSDPAP